MITKMALNLLERVAQDSNTGSRKRTWSTSNRENSEKGQYGCGDSNIYTDHCDQ
jgi:hypothetical protein